MERPSESQLMQRLLRTVACLLIVTAAVIVTLTLISAAKASASTIMAAPVPPFDNCQEAWSHGLYNIPESSPYYHVKLDSDHDGYACDDGSLVGSESADKPRPPETTTKPVAPPLTRLPKTGPLNVSLAAWGFCLVALGLILCFLDQIKPNPKARHARPTRFRKVLAFS